MRLLDWGEYMLDFCYDCQNLYDILVTPLNKNIILVIPTANPSLHAINILDSFYSFKLLQKLTQQTPFILQLCGFITFPVFQLRLSTNIKM